MHLNTLYHHNYLTFCKTANDIPPPHHSKAPIPFPITLSTMPTPEHDTQQQQHNKITSLGRLAVCSHDPPVQWNPFKHGGRKKSALFWDVTQRRLAVTYRRFETTYRSHPETSVHNVQSRLCNITEERRTHLDRCCSLTSHTRSRYMYCCAAYSVGRGASAVVKTGI
jgi:hypothetical protein